MDDEQGRERYEQMCRRRGQVMNEIARVQRRAEQNAIFNILQDRKELDHGKG